MDTKDIYRTIIEKIESGTFEDDEDLTKVKLWACRTLGLKNFPKNSEILAVASKEQRDRILPFLQIKPIRSISGVYMVTVMPKPYPCPTEEACLYCPGGPSNNTPQSYTGKEPAGRRAIEHQFDPYDQVKSRIDQFYSMGHNVDKVELIIFGGTLTAYPKEYLENFIVQCLNAISGGNAKTMKQAQLFAEKSAIRNSDITLETRPDWCKPEDIDLLLHLGTTRLELGVQTVYDDVYKKINRGHNVEEVIQATQRIKDAGFATIYHMMTGLPGSSIKRDLKAFETIFQNSSFKPDAIKIYPTLILPGTELYQMWKKGEYVPYSLEDTIELVAEIKKQVPPWVRIQRIQRDIPQDMIAAGLDTGELRLKVQERLNEKGSSCRCIRCREIGHVQYKTNKEIMVDDLNIFVDRYQASGGEELFISLEDGKRNAIIGLLRLRNPSVKSKLESTMLVRELHVFGPTVQVGLKAKENEWQHRGWGEALINEGERIARQDFDAKKILVLAGIGTREYYKKFGYERSGPYMLKNI